MGYIMIPTVDNLVDRIHITQDKIVCVRWCKNVTDGGTKGIIGVGCRDFEQIRICFCVFGDTLPGDVTAG